MATLYTEQASNVRHTWFLLTIFLALIVAIGWIFGQVYNNQAILYFALIFSLVMNFTSYWWSDKISLALAAAKPTTRTDYPELYRVVENLAITAGLPLPQIYIINDSAPNAFATGRDKKHAAIAVTSGLLTMMDTNELAGVIAHELSHIGNRDILLSSVVVVLVGVIALLSDIFMRSLWWGNRERDREGGAIFLILGLLAAILAPIAATLIQLAISRKREFLADADGALLTRYPEGLANALRKISGYSRPMRKASTATAHLFIASPFGSTSGTGLAKLFMTHPPVEERIAALLRNS